MTLTNEERERFAAYLERDASDTRAIIAQMEKTMPGPMLEQMTRPLKAEAMAAEVVVRKLRSVTLEDIGR